MGLELTTGLLLLPQRPRLQRRHVNVDRAHQPPPLPRRGRPVSDSWLRVACVRLQEVPGLAGREHAAPCHRARLQTERVSDRNGSKAEPEPEPEPERSVARRTSYARLRAANTVVW